MITVTLGIDPWSKANDLTAKNIAYAAVNGVNNAALKFQDRARDNLKARFTVRQAGIEKLAAVIKPFANVRQSRPFAEIAVGQKNGLLLGDFEKGGTKRSRIGAHVAVPLTGSPARPGFPSPVVAGLRITALAFKQGLTSSQRKDVRAIKADSNKATRAARAEKRRQLRAGSKKAWEGRDRTYLIPNVGIFQRQGGSGQGKRGSSTTRKLYSFLAAPKLKPQMHFIDLAKSEGQRMLNDAVQAAVDAELRKRS